jgi:HK97 family phage prohead protease
VSSQIERDVQHKVFDVIELEVKDADDDRKYPNGVMEGYAATWQGPDLQKEIIARGAFAKTLKEQKSVPVLDQHSSFGSVTNAIGRTLEMKEDNRGLWFKAFFASTDRAQEVRKLIVEKVIDRLSIGYRIINEARDRVTGITTLRELALMEISPVIFPANPTTSVAAKSQGESDGLKAFREGVSTLVRIAASRGSVKLSATETRTEPRAATVADLMKVCDEVLAKAAEAGAGPATKERVDRVRKTFGNRY